MQGGGARAASPNGPPDYRASLRGVKAGTLGHARAVIRNDLSAHRLQLKKAFLRVALDLALYAIKDASRALPKLTRDPADVIERDFLLLDEADRGFKAY